MDDPKKLRTQVESILNRKAVQIGCSNTKLDENIKSAKKGGATGNYFLTADVSSVLRAINLNMEGSMGRKNQREMTEEDIDKLFGQSQTKKKRCDKENNSNYNFKPARKELMTSKASMGGTAARLHKKDLVTDPDRDNQENDFDLRKQETMKVGNVREFLNTPEEPQQEHRILGKSNKDFA